MVNRTSHPLSACMLLFFKWCSTKVGSTPAWIAAAQGHLKVVVYLVKKCAADPHQPNKVVSSVCELGTHVCAVTYFHFLTPVASCVCARARARVCVYARMYTFVFPNGGPSGRWYACLRCRAPRPPQSGRLPGTGVQGGSDSANGGWTPACCA